MFLFDVDGTLTPSRGKINEDFRLYMVDFCNRHKCYLITGSDQQKTIEQIGLYLYNQFQLQFQCSGNEVFCGNTHRLYKSEWKLSQIQRMFLLNELKESSFSLRTGHHIEDRVGLVNFSIVGRNASHEERQLYVKWDNETEERKQIAKRFNKQFPEVEAKIGGETGIDICEKGKNKAQIIDWFIKNDEPISFFGDACFDGGNDAPLAELIIEKGLGFVYNVSDYKETWKILEEIDFAISSIH